MPKSTRRGGPAGPPWLPLLVLGVLAGIAASAARLAVLRRPSRWGAAVTASPDGLGIPPWSDDEPTVLPDVDALLRDIERVEARRARMRGAAEIELYSPGPRAAERPSLAHDRGERVLV